MLDKINSPRDLDGMSYEQLDRLAAEIRNELISTVSTNGGHLASNLGIVELTLALHRVFHMPDDKIIFDVGHQSYVHKMITGRYNRFSTLRSYGGIAGFPKRSESEYDCFETGHASTAISAALGMARARDYRKEKHEVIAVVGDGALTGGMCYEALNDAGNSGTKMIVVLNDNEMSIAPNVGALSNYLTQLRISAGWQNAKRKARRLNHIPMIWVGGAVKGPRRIEQICNQTDLPATLLGQLGINHDAYTFSRDVLSKTYTQPIAIHTYDDGFTMIDSTSFVNYDFISHRIVTSYGGRDSLLIHKAKAILQAASKDLNER